MTLQHFKVRTFDSVGALASEPTQTDHDFRTLADLSAAVDAGR